MITSPFISRAQNLEDVVLWRALGHIHAGRYVDIGACDPRCSSVSHEFYRRGWRGVHFEPHPEHAAGLRAGRPDEQVHEVALSDACGEIDFFLSPVEGTSTGVREHVGGSCGQTRVTTRTLASFGTGWAGSDVHWMKIDVEGMEEKVLRGWDPRLLRPWVLVIEATRPHSRVASHASWEPLVLEAGYRFALFDGLNRFYAVEERPEIRESLAAPANIFDLMAGVRLEAWGPFVTPQGNVDRHLDEAVAMRNSLSWRLTAPLRWLHDALFAGTS